MQHHDRQTFGAQDLRNPSIIIIWRAEFKDTEYDKRFYHEFEAHPLSGLWQLQNQARQASLKNCWSSIFTLMRMTVYLRGDRITSKGHGICG